MQNFSILQNDCSNTMIFVYNIGNSKSKHHFLTKGRDPDGLISGSTTFTLYAKTTEPITITNYAEY